MTGLSTVNCLAVVLFVASDVIQVDGLNDPRLPAIFYPFGTDVGDRVAPVNDDSYSSSISLNFEFRFFNRGERTLFVSIFSTFDNMFLCVAGALSTSTVSSPVMWRLV